MILQAVKIFIQKTSSIQVAGRNSYITTLHPYLYNISGVTVLHHKRRTVDLIFQIRISRNTKCADMTGFPRPGHIYYLYAYTHPRIHTYMPT